MKNSQGDEMFNEDIWLVENNELFKSQSTENIAAAAAEDVDQSSTAIVEYAQTILALPPPFPPSTAIQSVNLPPLEAHGM